MKRMLSLLICFSLLIASLALFSCNTSGNGADEGSTDEASGAATNGGISEEASEPGGADPQEPTSLTLAENGSALYKIVCPDNADETVAALALTLSAELSERAGALFEAGSDFVMPDVDPDGVSEYEILIAGTNRSADDRCLAEADTDGWCVSVVGTRIVIHARSLLSLTEAVEYFKLSLTQQDGKLCFETARAKVESKSNPLVGTTLRVGSYNIKHGADVKLDFSVIADDIKALDLDVIGFQEIDKCTKRVNGIDTPKKIAEALGYDYYHFTKGINYQGGEYGTLIVSRYPIENAESITFPTHSGYETRAMGHVTVNVNGAKLEFYNTHLSYEKDFLVEEQFGLLAEELVNVRGFVVTGDFNTDKAAYFDGIGNSYRVNRNTYVTFPSSSKCIDNIVLESCWETVSAGVGPDGHSDHKLLWAEIRYTAWED
ncbi:MAG: endonuclease/exonuclease/phosphatase family protein [Clostridia bacterium]|nr:endonuclease/exonuclease/phosphatase family protein [Clostridia bacterium]